MKKYDFSQKKKYSKLIQTQKKEASILIEASCTIIFF